MKKRFLFLALLLPFIFTGCDDINFGVQWVDDSYFILEDVDSLDITVTCESEKLNIYENTECTNITDERMLNYVREYGIISGNKSYKIFDVHSIDYIHDHKNVTIFFKVNVDGEIYKGKLNISTLKSNSGKRIDWETFKLNTDSGKVLSAIFTYTLNMSI